MGSEKPSKEPERTPTNRPAREWIEPSEPEKTPTGQPPEGTPEWYELHGLPIPK